MSDPEWELLKTEIQTARDRVDFATGELTALQPRIPTDGESATLLSHAQQATGNAMLILDRVIGRLAD